MSLHPRLQWLLTDPHTPPAAPHAKNEHWSDRLGMSGPINGLDASWTAFGQTVTGSTLGRGAAVFHLHSGAGAGFNLAGFSKVQPTPPYTVTCKVGITQPLGSDVTQAGLGFRDNGGKLWLAVLYRDFVTATDEFRRVGFSTQRRASPTVVTSTGAGYIIGLPRDVWMRITNDGSNVSWAWSPTGVEGTFETVVTESYATALLTPTQFCIWLDSVAIGQELRAKFSPLVVT